MEVRAKSLGQEPGSYMKILVMMSGQPARILLGFGKRPATLQRRYAVDKIPRQQCGHELFSHELRGQGMMAVLSVPLPSINWNKTFVKHASGSSACTNAAAVTPLDSIRSSASRNARGVWWKLALQVISE